MGLLCQERREREAADAVHRAVVRTRAELEELLEMQKMRLLASSYTGPLRLEENGIFQHVLRLTLGSRFRGQGYIYVSYSKL